ncbi:MAG TPA: hypothetical protein VK623_10530 [Flavobacterium sp.]|nr:hypothetical protein [Flavobacterium sp.]
MSKKFKIVYYFLVALLTFVFSYGIFQLVAVLQDKPNHGQKEFIAGDD